MQKQLELEVKGNLRIIRRLGCGPAEINFEWQELKSRWKNLWFCLDRAIFAVLFEK